MIHCYCGDGKGKTTAAMGLALRYCGSGGRVLIVQFLKGSESCEIYPLQKLDNIQVLRLSRDMGFTFSMDKDTLAACRAEHDEMLAQACKFAFSGSPGMLILDEVTYPYNMGLLDRTSLEKLITSIPPDVELVLTGRDPAPLFLDNADYISQINNLKHPFDKSIPPRRGVEF